MSGLDALISSGKIAQIIPPILIASLMVIANVWGVIRERRGRKLFMLETGKSKAEWDNLAPSQQKEWSRRDADDREINRFIEDFNRQKKK